MSKNRRASEDAAWEIALADHPEWGKALNRDSLPDEIIGEDGEPMSPRLHLEMHAIVERQLAADDPQGIVAIARELEELGVSRHDVRHEIGRAISSQMWYMLKEGCSFDQERYFATLRQIVQSQRRRHLK